MRIVVTGSTGFVGRQLVARLLENGHQITAVARNLDRARLCPWFDRVRFVFADLEQLTDRVREQLGEAEVIVHLAWPGLPNYRDLFHFEENLPMAYAFLKACVTAGYPRLLVTGTCFEYGMQAGRLSETMDARPSNPYGLAKDSLRKFLEALQSKYAFGLQWCRLFYMFGEGQNPQSLLAQLESAIRRGDQVFPMSGGEQLRDFLSVSEVGRRLTNVIEHPKLLGIVNICSGSPTSVRSLVESRIALMQAKIEPQLGVYSYPDYEPFAFWGDPTKYLSIENQQ